MTARRAKALPRKRLVSSDGTSRHWKNPRHENRARNIDPIFNSLLGRLVVLPLKIDWLFTNYGVIRLANRTLAPAVKEFIEILREVESEIV